MKKRIPKIETSLNNNNSNISNKLSLYFYYLKNPRIFLKKILEKFFFTHNQNEKLDYKELYIRFGQNAVIDHRHSLDEYEYVTKMQKEILLPILKHNIKSPIKNILDFDEKKFNELIITLWNKEQRDFQYFSQELVYLNYYCRYHLKQ